MKLEFSRQNFEKYSNIKLHEYPASVRAELFHAGGLMDGRTDRQAHVTKLIVALAQLCGSA